jgi:hypothetical protein
MSSNSMKRYQIVFLAGAVISLAACGEGTTTDTGTTTGTTTGTPAANKIVGSWARCNVTGATSNKVVTGFGAISAGPIAGGFNGQQMSSQITNFTDPTCQVGGALDTSQGIGTHLFLLGSGVTVDGTVAGITEATQYSGHDGGTSPGTSSVDFDIIAANATQLFFGDKSTNTGTTLALQPTQLETAAYTKQVALSSIDGTWSSCFVTNTGSSLQADIVLNNGVRTETRSTFVSADCTGAVATQLIGTFTYTLGELVVTDGTTLGITAATKWAFTQTNADLGGAIGNKEFDIVAIKANKMFFGDSDGANDGSTDAKSPTQIDGAISYDKIP